MTIDKKEVITIPRWKVIYGIPIVVGIITSLLTVFGTLTAFRASVEEKLIIQKETTLKLEDKKVDRSEQVLIMKSLDRIEKKLDDHIDKN